METEQAEKPKWVDKNRNQRANKRRAQLNAIANQHGFSTWVKLETACLNGATLEVLGGFSDLNVPEYSEDDSVYQLVSGAGVFSREGLAVIVPIPEDHGSIS